MNHDEIRDALATLDAIEDPSDIDTDAWLAIGVLQDVAREVIMPAAYVVPDDPGHVEIRYPSGTIHTWVFDDATLDVVDAWITGTIRQPTSILT